MPAFISYTVNGQSFNKSEDDFVRSVQRAVGATEDGIWGPGTTDRLISAMNSTSLAGYTDTIRREAMLPQVGRQAMLAGAYATAVARNRWNEAGLASVNITQGLNLIPNFVNQGVAAREEFVRTAPSRGHTSIPYTEQDSARNTSLFVTGNDPNLIKNDLQYSGDTSTPQTKGGSTQRRQATNDATNPPPAGGNNQPPPAAGWPWYAYAGIAAGAAVIVGGGVYAFVKYKNSDEAEAKEDDDIEARREEIRARLRAMSERH